MNKKSFFFLFVLQWLLVVSLRAQTLYVGTNYHPHDDKNIEKIKRDIQLMKAAGFNAVRMGHLAWDSYEPSEGKFDFAWFDKVMDLMNEAGIKVMLDIAIHPAPLWLHTSILQLMLSAQMAISCIRTIVIWTMLEIRCIKNSLYDMPIHFPNVMLGILH